MVEPHRQEIAKLEALYASNPGGRVFVHLAEALRRAGEYERARSIVEEGLARHPDSASGYVVLGRVMLDRGDKAAAETAFRKVLQLDGGNLVALRSLGDLASAGGRPAEATSFYRELIARNPASEADASLMRLLDEAQRGAAEAALVAVAREHEAREAAIAEWEGAAAAMARSDSAAPGRAGRARWAEPEYGTIELDALPGDLASFAGLASPRRAPALDEPEPEPRGLEDDVVVLLESSAAPLQLEELETELAASPAEVNLLSATPDLELPRMREVPAELTSWSTDAAQIEPGILAEEAPEGEATGVAGPGGIDVDAAMLNLGQLSAATPFEVTPEATELTLVDDDTVRVAMSPAEQAPEGGDAEAPLQPLEELAAVEEAMTEAPSWAAAEVFDDARTQDAAELTIDEAGDAAAEYEDLPWLVEPADSALTGFGATGVGEEPGGATDAAAAGEAFPTDREIPIGDAPAAEVVDEFPVPLELAGEFEAAAEHAAADVDVPWEGALAAGAEEGEAAPDVESERDRTRFVEDVEAEPELATFMEAVEAGRNAAGFVPDAEFASFEERLEAEAELARLTRDSQVAPGLTDYVEDVEAEAELAGFADEVEVEAQYTGYMEDVEQGLASYDEDMGAALDRSWLDEELVSAEREPMGAAPSSDFELEELEPFARPSEELRPAAEAELAWQDEFAVTGGPEPDAVPVEFGRIVDEVPEPAWSGAETDLPPLSDVSPLGADIGMPEPYHAPPATEAGASAARVSGDLGTETLADLYRAQGFAQRAAEVYRALLRQQPADERLAAKLHEAEAALAAGRGAEPGEDAGDVWLRGVESAWTGGAGATGQETTPYAWTEREEREQGVGIGAYLRELIGWGTGEVARARDAGTAAPTAGAAAEPAGQSTAQEGVSPSAVAEPDWFAEPETSAPTPEARGTEPGDAPAGGAPWSMTPEPVLDETWSGAEPDEPWTMPVEPPQDPWLAPEPTAVRGRRPVEATESATAANPVEEAFNEWFGPPSEPAAPVAAHGKPRRATEAGVGEAPEAAGAEDEDDEDLEMFRAWLQSLKK